MKVLDRLQPLGLLMLRGVLGAVMIYHGYPKLLGGNLPKHVAFVSSLGMPGWLAYVSAAAELVGGVLLIGGLLTRVAAFFVLGNMLVALLKVKMPRGWAASELDLTLIAMAFALILFGAGPIALDQVFFRGGGAGKTSR